MNKYYVTTLEHRNIEQRKASLIECKTAKEAASMILGGKWKKANKNHDFSGMAIVYKLKSFELLSDDRIDATRTMYYEKCV